jgi:hypothetical protein
VERRRLFWGVSSRTSAGPVSTGVIVGGVAAAATTGALIAMGHRMGSAAIPFAAISATLFRRTPASGAVGLVFTGIVLHVTATFVWSVVFVWLVERLRWSSIVAAAFIGVAHFVLSWLVAWGTGEGLASILPLGDRIVFALILTASLVVGMRFAFLPLRNA